LTRSSTPAGWGWRSYFRAVLNDIQVRPNRALFLDDREENVDAAHGVGLHAIEFSLQAGLDALNHVLAEFGLPPPLRDRQTQGRDR
jgi:FMN phosphatase YigB (HAD superfamily)